MRNGSLDFWTRMLCGAPLSAIDMSLHWVDGISIQFSLEREATNRLLGQCRKLACSPFIALLAAQALLLCRLGGGHDLVINVPFSNRADAADQLIVGNLSILTHLRIQLDPNERAGDFIKRLRDLVLNAMKHRNYDYPVLSDIVARDAHERGGIAHRMMGCSYVVERVPEDGLLLERVTPPVMSIPQTPNGSFALSCRHRHQEMEISVVWDPQQWPLTGEQLQDQFRELLDMLAAPDTIVRDLTALLFR
jgi:Condensation domain